MLNFLGIYYEGNVNSNKAKLQRSEGELVSVYDKKSMLETTLNSLNSFKKNNFAISIGLFFFLQIVASPIRFMAVGYFLVSSAIASIAIESNKKKINEYKREITQLEKEISKLKEQLNIAESDFNADNFVDAEIINEYPDDPNGENGQTETSHDENAAQRQTAAQSQAKYSTSIPEAALAYQRLDELKSILPVIGARDNALYVLFKNANDAAEKVRMLIQGDPGKEIRAYLFYNNVETLHKWADGVEDLYQAEVYESLLSNIKNQASVALPVLQEKINKDYYKIVYPDILDIEAEMTVMSKENK